LKIHSFNTVIVGSGAAAFSAALALYDLGQKDIAIVTEGVNRGTSRNTGSDKQTYYKMSTSGKDGDSPYAMAQTLFDGGAMHGDIALIEAALSLMCFYRLKNIGVPFPTDTFGQHVGYKTDHDPFTRASSVGPLTSKIMTEKLENQVGLRNIKIYDRHQVTKILTDESKKKSVGLVCIDLSNMEGESHGISLFNCTNIIYCTGGPSCMYYNSVFPKSQFGATGVALEAGVTAQNLGEWQYGLASTQFRWNVSGTYQQVIPRYVSTDKDGGDEQEFLTDYFDSNKKMFEAIFLKGYQWPFDPRKLEDFASSNIDMLVYVETQMKGRRVFLDFTKNPENFEFNALSDESYRYLNNSNALIGTPIDRLKVMNPLAIALYKNNGIDIENEYLEIDMCAQHNNGGLKGDIWWQSNLTHFFHAGEVSGTLGVYRPGGSALNATQVGSMRAAEYISAKYTDSPPSEAAFLKMITAQLDAEMHFIKSIQTGSSNVMDLRLRCQKLMTKSASFIRDIEAMRQALDVFKAELKCLAENAMIGNQSELAEVLKNRDMLICQISYLSAMIAHINHGGKSRGSYLVTEQNGASTFAYKNHRNNSGDGLNVEYSYSIDKNLYNFICETTFTSEEVIQKWVQVRPIPEKETWFETVWRAYRDGEIYN